MLHELNKKQNRHLMAKIDGHKHYIQKLMVAEWDYFTLYKKLLSITYSEIF